MKPGQLGLGRLSELFKPGIAGSCQGALSWSCEAFQNLTIWILVFAFRHDPPPLFSALVLYTSAIFGILTRF